MNVLLINPPAHNNIKIVREGRCMQREDAWGTSWAPITLATIGAVLKESGFKIRIKDCTKEEIDTQGLKNIVKEFKPTLAVINTATPSIDNDLSAAAAVKAVDPKIKTSSFGIHVTALDKQCLQKHPYLDCIIRREPEYTVKDLSQAIRDNLSWENITGISWQQNGSIWRNEDREFIQNLDCLPFPAWEEVNLNSYTMPITGEVFLLVMTSRGCPYPCTFCAAHTLYGKKRRYRSAKRIVDEMAYLSQRFGVKSFLFWAEGFVSDKKHVYAVCDEITKRNCQFKWVANSRVDTIDLPMLKRMRQAGCWMIGYGVESGNQNILDQMKKGVRLTQIEQAIKLTRQAGIKTTAHVIIGTPGESKKDILKTSAFINKLDIDFLQLYCCVPFPGSTLYDEAKKNNWINTEDWEMFEQNFSVLNTAQISAAEIMRLRKKVFRSFYLQPRRTLRVIKNIKSLQELKNFSTMVKNFTRWT